ncbi:hypothetical protein PgNI_05250 [Pyricularia grisea]|uniref:Uncharacterized protein n=1 Tax=Pyricularia grisea TaxID=148305 RepID=A0A6P8B5K2_PYRGI|nr:hypothetical protein PgNI_05250 [Pyricularia grisea]TLD10572.1 hypothetical protein PgNI_05250 [Pyricularia grisea]
MDRPPTCAPALRFRRYEHDVEDEDAASEVASGGGDDDAASSVAGGGHQPRNREPSAARLRMPEPNATLLLPHRRRCDPPAFRRRNPNGEYATVLRGLRRYLDQQAMRKSDVQLRLELVQDMVREVLVLYDLPDGKRPRGNVYDAIITLQQNENYLGVWKAMDSDARRKDWIEHVLGLHKCSS